MTGTHRPPRLLVLFQGAWEDEALFRRVRQGELVLEREGFELLDRSQWHRLVHFDAPRFVDRLCKTYRGRIDAVWSNDDGLGCLTAALMAQRLGLPGHDPRAIVRAQHKLLLRQTLAAAMPGENVPAMALPFAFGDRRCRSAPALEAAVHAAGHRWPRFCKPVKGAFSALARRVDSADELAAHLRLPWRDRFLLRGISRPFDQLAGQCMRLPCSVDRLLLEEPLDGAQVNVDGFVQGGTVHVLGIVDEWMYAGAVRGARHFAGFTYPSRHPAAAQERIRGAAIAAVQAVGLTQGLWNVELFLLADGSVRVIEVNARGAGQFATLYRDVDGVDVEGIAIALATGQDALQVPRRAPVAAVAGSLVFRRFDGSAGPEPDPAALPWLESAHPEARLWHEAAGRAALRREYRWFGSHRFAVLNLSARDFDALAALGESCARRLFGETVRVQLAH
ncbi:MAG: ATP-grasp domain-containing protein [Planctomycetes bacterium]|nr:ATP-grasp domain-containing protein [Planctomycetota bacterium]